MALASRAAHPAALRLGLAARHRRAAPLAMQMPTHVALAMGERLCTLDEPCAFDAQTALELLSRVGLTTAVAVGVVVVLSAAMADVDDEAADLADGGRSEAGGADGSLEQRVEPTTSSGDGDADGIAWLEKQAERSRARRQSRLRELAERLEPVAEITGWTMRGADGLPTLDAFVFLGVAIASQLLLVLALAEAFS